MTEGHRADLRDRHRAPGGDRQAPGLRRGRPARDPRPRPRGPRARGVLRRRARGGGQGPRGAAPRGARRPARAVGSRAVRCEGRPRKEQSDGKDHGFFAAAIDAPIEQVWEVARGRRGAPDGRAASRTWRRSSAATASHAGRARADAKAARSSRPSASLRRATRLIGARRWRARRSTLMGAEDPATGVREHLFPRRRLGGCSAWSIAARSSTCCAASSSASVRATKAAGRAVATDRRPPRAANGHPVGREHRADPDRRVPRAGRRGRGAPRRVLAVEPAALAADPRRDRPRA